MADNRFANKQRALDRMKRIPVQVRIDVRGAVDSQGAYLVEQIRPHVPREHGDLAASLEWHRSPRQDKISVLVTEGVTNDPHLRRKARGVEFGHIDARSGVEVPAQPHFFPTYRAIKRGIRRAISKAAKAAIGKAIR